MREGKKLFCRLQYTVLRNEEGVLRYVGRGLKEILWIFLRRFMGKKQTISQVLLFLRQVKFDKMNFLYYFSSSFSHFVTEFA